MKSQTVRARQTPEPRVHFFLPGVARVPVGGYKVVYQYAEALAAAGYTVSVWHSAAFMADSPGTSKLRSTIRALGHVQRNRRYLSEAKRWFRSSAAVELRLVGTLPRPRLSANDIVIGTAVQTFRHAAEFASAAGASSLGFVQHVEEWGVSREYVLDRWAYPDGLVVIAPWLAELAREIGAGHLLLPNAMQASAFPLGPNLASRPPAVLSLLSHHDFKRPDVVIETMRLLHAERPDVELSTFGQLSRPDSLPDFVSYSENPSAEQLQTLYQNAVVYFCASDAEGWHLPPAEATLSGATVVSTNIGGVRASMGAEALYSPVGDSQELARNVLRALDDLEASQKRVDDARARLLSYTAESNVEEIIAFARALKPSESTS